MDVKEIGEMIKTMRQSRKMSQAQLAKAVNVSQSAIFMWEHGERKPSDEAIEALADVFNVSKLQLLYRDDELRPIAKNMYPYTPARAMVPIIGAVRCGPGGLAFEDLQGAEIADVPNPAEYFYLRADGDSMEPKISAGDLVLIHKQEEVENGELAVVIINGEEGTLKRFMQKDGAVILQSFNPAYPPRIILGEELKLVRIAGKAVELKRKL